MASGEWVHDLACLPWQSHSGFYAQGWRCKVTEIVTNVQAGGKGHPTRVRQSEEPTATLLSWTACMAQQSPWLCPQILPFGSACYQSLDHWCSQWFYLPSNFLLIQSFPAKISYICFCCLWTRNLPGGEGQRQAQHCAGPWEGGGESGLAICNILLN